VDVWRVMCLESSNYLLFSLRDCFVCLFLNTLLKIERGGETLLPIYPMGHKQSVILRLNTTFPRLWVVDLHRRCLRRRMRSSTNAWLGYL
jgi:hypothetical protein